MYVPQAYHKYRMKERKKVCKRNHIRVMDPLFIICVYVYVCMYMSHTYFYDEGFRGRLSVRGSGDGHAMVCLVGQGVLLLRGGSFALK